MYICLSVFSISRAAGWNCIYATEDEVPPPLVEEPKPPLGEEPEEDDAEGESEHEEPPPLEEVPNPAEAEEEAEEAEEDAAEGDEREFSGDGGYIRNMVDRWAGDDYESSEDDHAPWHHRGD